jgi:hypothetical protein
MGYTTEFEGSFKIDGELTAKQLKQLERFCGGTHNVSDDGCPGGYCQWTIGEDGDTVEWDGGEKFYDYVEWMQYLIGKFFEPWGYTLNGEVMYSGESIDDNGTIRVVNNLVEVIELASASEVEQLRKRIEELENELRELKAKR